MPDTPALPETNSSPWTSRPLHRQWLAEQAGALLDFFARGSVNPEGGFYELDMQGEPLDTENPVRAIHATTRMIHSFAAASLMGRPGADAIVDHGMRYLWSHHRDAEHGGYLWSLDGDGPKDDTKQAYGHAFVLLAGSSAKLVGHPLAERVIADVTEVIETRFWEAEHGAVSEEYGRDWSAISAYRGQNSNMHLTEALMAAFEATGERSYLERAESIAGLIIGKHAKSVGYRVAEHFFEDWRLDKDFHDKDNEMFRPAGTTPGHWLEWSRLLMQLWVLGGKRHDWLGEASRELFRQSIALGWDETHGGFFYTLDWSDRPAMREKLWWPLAEGIGAAAFIGRHDSDPFYEAWYRRMWDFAAANLIDHAHGGWRHELAEDLTPREQLFVGKPDIYHALQACLIPMFPATGSVTRAIIEAGAG